VDDGGGAPPGRDRLGGAGRGDRRIGWGVPVRVQIKPGLAQAWRGPRTLQIGLDPARGTVLDGLTDGDRRLLAALDAGLDASPDTMALVARGAVDASRARTLLGLLAQTGVLARSVGGGSTAATRLGPGRAALAADAAAWSLVHPDSGDGWELVAGRRGRTVEVVGRGRTATALVEALRAAGVGTVREVEASPGAPRAGLWPDVAVLVDRLAADAAATEVLLREDVAHLSVVVQEGRTLVGPLVRGHAGPCLRCLDLHRRDRDPQWPQVLEQLLRPARRTGGASTGRPGGSAAVARRGLRGPEEAASAALAGSLAALQVLAHLDGHAVPAAVGATLEVELPDGLVSRRPWPAHPSCGCSWPPPAIRSGGAVDQDGRVEP